MHLQRAKGRGVFATRPIFRGETIFRELPVTLTANVPVPLGYRDDIPNQVATHTFYHGRLTYCLTLPPAAPRPRMRQLPAVDGHCYDGPSGSDERVSAVRGQVLAQIQSGGMPELY